MKVFFLVSGNGGNLKFIHSCIKNNIIKGIDLTVIGDRECGAIDYARKHEIRSYVISYSKDYNVELRALLDELNPDYIITSWHKVIDEYIVNRYYGKIINLHYSILPAFSGMIGEKPILEAIKKKCKFIGATIHYVNERVDDGEIIIQGVTKNNEDVPIIIDRVFKMGCFMLLNTLISKNPQILIKPYHNEKKSNITDDHFIFEPKLLFDSTWFDHQFWERLRESNE